MRKFLFFIVITLSGFLATLCNTKSNVDVLYIKKLVKIDGYHDSTYVIVYNLNTKQVVNELTGENLGGFWNVVNNEIITVYGNKINVLNIDGNVRLTFDEFEDYLAGFSINNNVGIISKSNCEENAPYTGKLYHVNLSENSIKKLKHKSIENAFGLNLSPSGNKLAFLSFDDYSSENPVEYLKVLDIGIRSITIIDSVYYLEECFGELDDPVFSCWNTDNELTYLKYDTDYNERAIYSYDFLKNTKKMLFKLPENVSNSYQYYKGKFIFLAKDNNRYKKIVEIDPNTNETTNLLEINSKSYFSSMDNFYIVSN